MFGQQAIAVAREHFDAMDTRDGLEPIGQALPIGFHLDVEAAAKHLPTEIGHRTHQRDASGVKQRNPVTNALYPFEQMRREQNRNALGLKGANNPKKLGGSVRIES